MSRAQEVIGEPPGRIAPARYMKGAFWRHFAVKYPEANWMHKKMLRVHGKVQRALADSGTAAGRDELWQAQCNCPYWHGVFGGLYAPHLRSALLHHLIQAETLLDSLEPAAKNPSPRVESRDFDRHVAACHEGSRHLPARLLPVIDDEMQRRVVHLSRFR